MKQTKKEKLIMMILNVMDLFTSSTAPSPAPPWQVGLIQSWLTELDYDVFHDGETHLSKFQEL